jgi:hypothetical protein
MHRWRCSDVQSRIRVEDVSMNHATPLQHRSDLADDMQIMHRSAFSGNGIDACWLQVRG